MVDGSTQEDVAKQLRTALVDCDNGKNLDESAVPVFATFAAGWLETVRPTLKPSSSNFYDVNLRRYIWRRSCSRGGGFSGSDG